MKKIYLGLAIISMLFLINSCTEDEEVQEETMSLENIDLSVSSQVNIIYWNEENDLNEEIQAAIIFNDASINQIFYNTEIIISDDYSSLTANIYLNQDNTLYIDNNQNNNTITIELVNVNDQNNEEFDDFDIDASQAQDLINVTFDDLCNFNLNAETILDIPIQLHRLRLNNSGSIITSTLQASILTRLNEEFSSAKLNFYYCGDVNYIANTTLYDTDKDAEEHLFNQYEIPNVLNIFIVNTINGYTSAGFAGFPFMEIADESISRFVITRFALNSPTLIHEAGHYFSLYHTFDNSVTSFSNCMFSNECLGDGICATSLSTVANEDNAESNGCDESISPVVRNFMSYGGSCRNRFDNNNEQLTRVAFSARTHRDFSDCGNTQNQSEISLSGNINFPNTQISTSHTQTLTITNTGTESFNITNISSSNSAIFDIVNPQRAVIQPNETLNVQIQFTPTQAQNYSATITVDNDADNANSSNSSIQVTGTGINNNTSNISVSGNLNFGDVEIGQSNNRTFTISNTGNQSFNVSSINFPSGAYSANWNSGTIGGGGSQNVTVTFQPNNVQSYNGTVTVNHNADSGNNTIAISGSGTSNNSGQPNLIFNDIDITSDDNNNGIAEAGESIGFNINLQNIGNATATNIEVIIATNDPDIYITDNDRTYDDMPEGDFEWNSGDFDFDIASDCPTKTVVFTMQINSDQGSWSDSFTINIQGANGGNPIPITPSDSCSSSPLMNLNTEYLVNIDVIDYTPSAPIDGYSNTGEDVRGFWLKVNTSSNYNGPIDIDIYDVSNNFDPVIGRKFNCSSIYYTQWNQSTYVADQNGNGGSETFNDYSYGDGYTRYIRIYHYNGNQTPNNISFKIKVNTN